MSDPRQPFHVFRPHFSTRQSVFEAVPLTLIVAAVLTLLGGTFMVVLGAILGAGKWLSLQHVYSVLFWGTLIFFPAVYFEFKRKAYRRTLYRFYDDFLDFQQFEFLLLRKVGRIQYTDIVDVAEEAGWIQDHENMMTLRLYTPALPLQTRGIFPGLSFSGLILSNIPRGEGNARKIMSLIEKKAPSSPSSSGVPQVASSF